MKRATIPVQRYINENYKEERDYLSFSVSKDKTKINGLWMHLGKIYLTLLNNFMTAKVIRMVDGTLKRKYDIYIIGNIHSVMLLVY